MPQVAQFSRIDVSAVFNDDVVFTLPAILNPWNRAKLPVLKSLYLDLTVAQAVDLYFAIVGAGFAEAQVMPLIRGTVQHESRFCYPFPVTSALVPYQLRMTKPVSAANGAFAFVEWELP